MVIIIHHFFLSFQPFQPLKRPFFIIFKPNDDWWRINKIYRLHESWEPCDPGLNWQKEFETKKNLKVGLPFLLIF